MNKCTIIRRVNRGHYTVVEQDMPVNHIEHAFDHYKENYLHDDDVGTEILFVYNGKLDSVFKVERPRNVMTISQNLENL